MWMATVRRGKPWGSQWYAQSATWFTTEIAEVCRGRHGDPNGEIILTFKTRAALLVCRITKRRLGRARIIYNILKKTPKTPEGLDSLPSS